jgi:hypothetical protein
MIVPAGEKTMNDSDSPNSIIHALYDSISGPAGKEPDWERMRALFFPRALLVRTTVAGDGALLPTVMDVEEYIDGTGDYLRREPFYEREIARRTESFGNVAHVFSTYESRREAGPSEPFMRGINSMQLFHDGERWWLLSVVWDNEREDQPIPGRYLPPIS